MKFLGIIIIANQSKEIALQNANSLCSECCTWTHTLITAAREQKGVVDKAIRHIRYDSIRKNRHKEGKFLIQDDNNI